MQRLEVAIADDTIKTTIFLDSTISIANPCVETILKTCGDCPLGDGVTVFQEKSAAQTRIDPGNCWYEREFNRPDSLTAGYYEITIKWYDPVNNEEQVSCIATHITVN
jgi:hypothetical protein